MHFKLIPMLEKLKKFKENHPFTSLMLIAIAVRIIVVICVPGFGSNRELQHTTLFIGFLEKMKSIFGIGESSGQGLMLLSRALYATVSLFTVSMIYRICDLTSNKQNAWLLALIPTFSIIMPSFGIIENASAFLGLPLLLYGANVVCTPGVGFGPSGEGYVRFTAFGSRETTEEALKRIKYWTKQH